MNSISCKNITNRENSNDQGTVESSHSGHKEDRVVDGIYLGVLKCLDVRCARPADLLEKPAKEGGGRVC